MNLQTEIKEGKNGRYRWYIRDGRHLVAAGPVNGYRTRESAQFMLDMFVKAIQETPPKEWSVWEICWVIGVSVLGGFGIGLLTRLF